MKNILFVLFSSLFCQVFSQQNNNDSIKEAVKLCSEAKENTNIKLVTIHHGDIVYKKEYIYLMAQQGSGLKRFLKNLFFPLYLKYHDQVAKENL